MYVCICIHRFNKELLKHTDNIRSYKKRKYKTPQEMETKINAYFDYCESTIFKTIVRTDKNDNQTTQELMTTPTLHGLYAFLDIHESSFKRYLKYPLFKSIIKKAREKIIKNLSENLLHSEYNTAGAIFLLKCYGLTEKDKQNGTNIQINNTSFKIVDATDETPKKIDTKNLISKA
jgi:hypothetical protein